MSYKTPGVYIEEVSKFPPSVAEVATAVPAFIGATHKDKDSDGVDLKNRPIRIASLLEFTDIFGAAKIHEFTVKVLQTLNESDKIIDTTVTFDDGTPPTPDDYLYYSMQRYFSNGGGPCYVVSIGKPVGLNK